MKTYTAPEGATSISVDGKSFEVDPHGNVSVPADAPHDHMLAHGYRLDGDALPVVVVGATSYPLATRATELDTREAALAERAASLDARETAIKQDRADLEMFEVALAQKHADANARTEALDARAADLDALAAGLTAAPPVVPPVAPPPPAPLPTGRKK